MHSLKNVKVYRTLNHKKDSFFLSFFAKQHIKDPLRRISTFCFLHKNLMMENISKEN